MNRDTILITGATGKLGRVFASEFARQGASLILVSRGGASIQDLESECLKLGAHSILVIESDLLSSDAISLIVSALTERSLAPNILINNVRNLGFLKLDLDGNPSRDGWIGEFSLGILVPYQLTIALAEMKGSLLKKVINIASIYGIVAPNPGLYEVPKSESPINYGVIKAGLIHLTKEMAVRYAAKNVQINAVSYGGVRGRADASFERRYGKYCPSGKMLDESDIFGAVKFLASPESDGVTGHNLVVDGGWTLW